MFDKDTFQKPQLIKTLLISSFKKKSTCIILGPSKSHWGLTAFVPLTFLKPQICVSSQFWSQIPYLHVCRHAFQRVRILITCGTFVRNEENEADDNHFLTSSSRHWSTWLQLQGWKKILVFPPVVSTSFLWKHT